MRLLLTCDDGIDSAGLDALVRAVVGEHDVAIVAPDEERSACGHSATLKGAIRVERRARSGVEHCFAVGGTPVDCVRLALGVLLEGGADCVVSGINAGANLSIFDVHSSGTVAGAREARLQGIPSVAISQMYRKGEPIDWDWSCDVARGLLRGVIGAAVRFETLLNVNVPPRSGDRPPGWIQVAPLSTARLPLTFERAEGLGKAAGGGGFEYRADFAGRDVQPGSDVAAVLDGAVSITAISVDATDRSVPISGDMFSL